MSDQEPAEPAEPAEGSAPAGPKHWRWRDQPHEGPAVVFDIDGVISNASGRQHFLEGPGKKDWTGFFNACGEDALIEEVARLIELLDPSVTVVLLTGRPIRVRRLTVAWLEQQGLRWDLLIMRPAGSYAKSLEFKRGTIAELRDAGVEPRLAFEDDRHNADMFIKEGVPCIYLHSGYYE